MAICWLFLKSVITKQNELILSGIVWKEIYSFAVIGFFRTKYRRWDSDKLNQFYYCATTTILPRQTAS